MVLHIDSQKHCCSSRKGEKSIQESFKQITLLETDKCLYFAIQLVVYFHKNFKVRGLVKSLENPFPVLLQCLCYFLIILIFDKFFTHIHFVNSSILRLWSTGNRSDLCHTIFKKKVKCPFEQEDIFVFWLHFYFRLLTFN